jgi:hypothetical protein
LDNKIQKTDSELKQDYINAIWNGYVDTELVLKAKKQMELLSLDVLMYLHNRFVFLGRLKEIAND